MSFLLIRLATLHDRDRAWTGFSRLVESAWAFTIVVPCSGDLRRAIAAIRTELCATPKIRWNAE